MKKVLAIGLVSALILACGASSQVPKAASDTSACVEDVIADVGGAIDIVKSAADCGMAVADFVAIVQTWINSNSSDASMSVAMSPKMARAHKLVEAGRVYATQHAK